MIRIALLLLLAAACSKSDSKKTDDRGPSAPSAPSARSAPFPPSAPDQGSNVGEHHGGGRMGTPEERRKRLEELRSRLDTNHDGKLSPDELSKVEGPMKFDDPASLDTNHDGDISVDELQAGLRARRERRGAGSAGSATP